MLYMSRLLLGESSVRRENKSLNRNVISFKVTAAVKKILEIIFVEGPFVDIYSTANNVLSVLLVLLVKIERIIT